VYTSGKKAKDVLEEQRLQIARTLQCRHSEIFFTSGGTESDNLALIGSIEAWKEKNPNKVPEILISAIEHPAVLDTAEYLKQKGAIVHKIYPNSEGLIRALDFKELITENTVLVSLMLVNNEIGTIQPVGALGRLVQEYREVHNSQYPLLHTDACQAGNYIRVLVPSLRADLVTINASKVYGPKAIGVLFVKHGTPIYPIIMGGGQERGLRSGTENIALAIGMAESFMLAQEVYEEESKRLKDLQKYFFDEIKNNFTGIKINGSKDNRIPNNINLTVEGITGEELVIRLSAYGIYISSKSTCSSIDSDGSYVILALGGSEQEARQTIRVTMGRKTEKSDLEYLLEKLEYIIKNYKV
jgi:cysteine desulfurase